MHIAQSVYMHILHIYIYIHIVISIRTSLSWLIWIFCMAWFRWSLNTAAWRELRSPLGICRLWSTSWWSVAQHARRPTGCWGLLWSLGWWKGFVCWWIPYTLHLLICSTALKQLKGQRKLAGKGYEMLWIFWIKSIWIFFQVSDEWGSSRSTFCQHWTTLDPVFLLFISPSFFHLLFSCYFLHYFLPSFLSFLLSLLVLVLSFLHPFLSSFLPFLFIFLLLPLETLAFFGSASKQDT